MPSTVGSTSFSRETKRFTSLQDLTISKIFFQSEFSVLHTLYGEERALGSTAGGRRELPPHNWQYSFLHGGNSSQAGYLQSIKSVKHNAAKSVNRSILKKSRHLGFGVFIVHSSMSQAVKSVEKFSSEMAGR